MNRLLLKENLSFIYASAHFNKVLKLRGAVRLPYLVILYRFIDVDYYVRVQVRTCNNITLCAEKVATMFL